METVEHFARILLITELFGKQVLLSNRDVKRLRLARARYGTVTAAGSSPDWLVTSDGASGEATRTHCISMMREEFESADRRSGAQGPRPPMNMAPRPMMRLLSFG
jgi:hypothetical protein